MRTWGRDLGSPIGGVEALVAVVSAVYAGSEPGFDFEVKGAQWHCCRSAHRPPVRVMLALSREHWACCLVV